MGPLRKTLVSLAGAAVLMLCAVSAQANTLNVPTQYATIASAVNAANSGDTILVEAGTYHESLSWVGKDLTLQGAGADQSIIDPSAANGGPGGQCLSTQSLSSASLLQGFTLQNGQGYYGGGMYNSSSTPRLTHCTFTGNSATYGGGMVNFGGGLVVTHCTFTGNSAGSGGGMYN